MEEAWLEAVTSQLSILEQQVQRLKEKLDKSFEYSQSLQAIEQKIEVLKNNKPTLSFPVKEMERLERSLHEANSLLQQSMNQKVIHHHHVPKLIWIAASLFFFLSLACSGWYNTTSKLNAYVANDTKYRYLKLNNNRNLQELLDITDSLYFSYHGMRDSVIQSEEKNEQKLKLLQEAIEKQKEADELRKKAKN